MNPHECGYLCDLDEQGAGAYRSDFGRRIYIHKLSFDAVAAESLETATRVYQALAGVVVAKLAYHDLVLESGLREELNVTSVRALGVRLAKQWQDPITFLLRDLAHQTLGRLTPGPRWVPLLSDAEGIAATCLDSNYYTFATTDDAARRMYADVEKISDVWKGVREGRAPYRDLTIIKGRALCWVGSSKRSDDSPLNQEQLEHIKEDVADQVENDLCRIAAEADTTMTISERACFGAFVSKSIVIVNRMALSRTAASELALRGKGVQPQAVSASVSKNSRPTFLAGAGFSEFCPHE